MNKNKKIGVIISSAMSITIVVGAGLLVLPGLSFGFAGKLGYLPWLIVALLMIPLLYIFAYFGAHNPSAGGIVGYIKVALGNRFSSVAEMIVLGTFTLGIPAIALIGSEYLRRVDPGISILQSGLAVICLAYLAGVVGLRISGGIQTAIATFIVVGLIFISMVFLIRAPHELSNLSTDVSSSNYHGVVAAVPIILFAYTGWEMTAFLAEDMENPKRDMPISIWASFVVVASLYIFISWIIASFAVDNDEWRLAPFVQLAKESLGEMGGVVVGVIATLLVVANVVAAFISASRGIYFAGREGVLPKVIGMKNANGQPIVAMTVTWIVFSAVIYTSQKNGFGAEVLLQLAGQNFFVLYLMCAVGFLKIHFGKNVKSLVGIIAIVGVTLTLTLFSIPGVLYCSALALGGFILSRKSSPAYDRGT